MQTIHLSITEAQAMAFIAFFILSSLAVFAFWANRAIRNKPNNITYKPFTEQGKIPQPKTGIEQVRLLEMAVYNLLDTTLILQKLGLTINHPISQEITKYQGILNGLKLYIDYPIGQNILSEPQEISNYIIYYLYHFNPNDPKAYDPNICYYVGKTQQQRRRGNTDQQGEFKPIKPIEEPSIRYSGRNRIGEDDFGTMLGD